MARVARVALLGGIAAVAGCARGEKQTSVAAGGGATTAAIAAPMGGATGCPPTGLWARCSLIARLESSGLAPHVDSALADEAPIPQKGLLIHLYGSELEAYFFPDSVSRKSMATRLDSAKYVAFDTPLPPLGDHPTLIANANLIAILHSRSDHQRERVNDAITAGAPQPSHP